MHKLAVRGKALRVRAIFLVISIALGGAVRFTEVHASSTRGVDASAPGVIPRTPLQQATLTAGGAAADDGFGSAVAISGNTALVGASGRDSSPYTNNGAAYVFIRNGASWTQQAELTANDKASNVSFGQAVAIQGDTAVVGALLDGPTFSYKGAVYVFTRSGTVWTQRAKLTASDYGNSAAFGKSVAIDGNTIVVGSSTDGKGAVYVFTGSGATWTQQAKIQAAEALPGDGFSNALAISGDTLAVGAPLDDVVDASPNDDNGRVYIYNRSGTTWSQQTWLVPSDTDLHDQFGSALALRDAALLIGAPGESTSPKVNNGAAYVYARVGPWVQQAKLLAADLESADGFGFSLALDSNLVAVIGAPQKFTNAAAFSGVSYIFKFINGSWPQQAEIANSDAAYADYFGTSVAIQAGTAIIGAPNGGPTLNGNEGAAYIFTTLAPSLRIDTVGVYKDGAWSLRNSNSSGNADITAIFGGDASDLPIVGDWDGDGVDTIGIYRSSTGVLFLSNSNTAPGVAYSLVFGNPGDTPFAGRWTVAMTHDGVGVYRPSNGILYQKKDLTTGYSDYFAVFGNPGDQGVAGDWDGNGLDSIGIIRPDYRGRYSLWYLTNNSQPAGITYSDTNFGWQIGSAYAIVGDWDGDAISTPGYLSTSGVFVLHPANNGDFTIENTFPFGPAGARPVAGKWIAASAPPSAPDILVRGRPPLHNPPTPAGFE